MVDEAACFLCCYPVFCGLWRLGPMLKGFSTTVGTVGFTMSFVGSVGSAYNSSVVMDKVRSVRSGNFTEMLNSVRNLVETDEEFVNSVVKNLSIGDDGYFWYNDGVSAVRSNVRVIFGRSWGTFKIIAEHSSGEYYSMYSNGSVEGRIDDKDVSAEKKYPPLYKLCKEWREGELDKFKAEHGEDAANELRSYWSRRILTEKAAKFIIFHVLMSLAINDYSSGLNTVSAGDL